MSARVLVWSERPSLALELLGEARRVADAHDGEVSLCVASEAAPNEVESYAAYGADVLYVPDKGTPDSAQWVDILTAVIAECQPCLVLVGATKTGMEVAARVAERCEASYAAWAVEISLDDATASPTAGCMLYAGSALVKYRFTRPLTVLSVAPGTFEPCHHEGRTARLDAVVLANENGRLTVVGERPKSTGGARLEEAKAIVDVGRGVKNLEDLEMVRSLASLLDGQVSCSRPVSSDRDWLPEWLGLSGAKVKPELCLTIGVSGAIQHVVGIRDSRVIAAVNNDENAAIFTQADLGVVADLNEFVPVLIERLRARRVRPAWK
jgi:electron transfer flavoprotein alpha subunit